MNAPDVILWSEAKLIVEGWHGGKHRAAFAMIRDALRRDWDWYVLIPVTSLLCRLNVYHYVLVGDSGCSICGRGAIEDDYTEDEIASACDCVRED